MSGSRVVSNFATPSYILILYLFYCKTFSYVKRFDLETFSRKLIFSFPIFGCILENASWKHFFWCLVHRKKFSYLIKYRIGANMTRSKQSFVHLELLSITSQSQPKNNFLKILFKKKKIFVIVWETTIINFPFLSQPSPFVKRPSPHHCLKTIPPLSTNLNTPNHIQNLSNNQSTQK